MADKTTEKLEQIKKELKESDAKIRQMAVKKLVNIRRPEVFALLVGASKDQDAHVRMYAASAIGTTDDPSAVPTLLVLLRDSDVMVRISAAKALRDCRQDMAIPRLLQTAQDENIKLRTAALTSLAAYHTEKATSLFQDALDDPSEEIRAIAAEALSYLISSLDFNKIHPHLDDPDPFVRQRIATVLGLTKNPAIKKIIETRLIIEDESNVIEALFDALINVVDNDSISIILPFLAEKYEDNIRILAIKLLTTIKNATILDSLYGLLDDDNQDIQLAVLDAIDEIGSPSSLPILQQIIDEEYADDEIISRRNEIIEKLQNIENSLKPVECIESVGSDIIVEHNPISDLIRNLGSSDGVIRIKASRELSRCNPTPFTSLYDALKDSNPLIRAYSAETIGLIGSEESAEQLKAYLIDPDPTVTAFTNWAYYRCLKQKPFLPSEKPGKERQFHKKSFPPHSNRRDHLRHK